MLSIHQVISISYGIHCVKSVHIRSFSGPYTDTFHVLILSVVTHNLEVYRRPCQTSVMDLSSIIKNNDLKTCYKYAS